MNGGPSGFHNAPVTKSFVIGSALFSILVGLRPRSFSPGFSYQDIFVKIRLWKLFPSVLAFSSTPELMFGLYLLYYFRVFERQIGSNKYSVFILFSLAVSSLFEVLALSLLKGVGLNVLASGPYGLIFASFVPFYFDIPVSSRICICGVPFTDKSFIYLAGLQLLLSSWKRSVLTGICGVLAGSLYRLNVFGIRRIKFPEFIASFFSRLPLSSTGSSSATGSSGSTIGNAPSYRVREMEGNYPPTAPPLASLEPPESSIATLVSMGFDRNSARQALMQARNDVNVATNLLLEAQSR
ncbi:hypothetical protein Scep_013677 [Stephania cephalantha]|uniref:UBA domain-containing protein n=1 Tax=Stephania cephalantha TaxID=152367 RepID=A0AAP0J2D5_9MAGN